MQHKNMQIVVDVDPNDVLNELDTGEIIDYLEDNRNSKYNKYEK